MSERYTTAVTQDCLLCCYEKRVTYLTASIRRSARINSMNSCWRKLNSSVLYGQQHEHNTTSLWS